MNDLMNIDRSLLSLSQYKLVSVFLFSSDAFVQSHTYIYNMYTWSYKKLNFKCCSRKRERKRERQKTGIDEQVKNLSKLIYIKIASHENIHKLLFNCHFLAKITAYISLIGYV